MGRFLWIAIILACFPASTHATRFTDRWVTLNPLDQESARDTTRFQLLTTYGVWGEYGIHGIERDIEHAYNIKLGGFVEFFRIRDEWSLAFVSDVELVANDQDQLFFRPRATFWQEGLLLSKRWNRRVWQLGYFHRCKHDVDNLQTLPCNGNGCERSLIYGSLQGKLLLPLELYRGAPGRLVLRGDLFTILQDDRIPEDLDDRLPNVERSIAALGLDVRTRFPTRHRWLGGYATGYVSGFLYGDEGGFFSRFGRIERTTWNAGVAAGVALQGNAHLRLGLAYEYLSDTSINPDPESAHLVTLQFLLLTGSSMW